MAQGRGISAIMLLFCMLVLYSEMAHAKTYVVGDAAGWTFNMTAWPHGKLIMADDILVFNYNSSNHNVVIVDAAGYSSCSASTRSKTYQSGHDHIQIVRGSSYFICTFPGHCQAGMKIAINAV
ncbi:Basic blue protein [Spatholobus suberectus]|nr:Basic blue protein [Spatholobus suberectus]